MLLRRRRGFGRHRGGRDGGTSRVALSVVAGDDSRTARRRHRRSFYNRDRLVGKIGRVVAVVVDVVDVVVVQNVAMPT